MTAVQLALDDCDPAWTDQHADHTPTRFDCRQHEISDLHGQHAGPHALRTVHTVPTREEYL